MSRFVPGWWLGSLAVAAIAFVDLLGLELVDAFAQESHGGVLGMDDWSILGFFSVHSVLLRSMIPWTLSAGAGMALAGCFPLYRSAPSTLSKRSLWPCLGPLLVAAVLLLFVGRVCLGRGVFAVRGGLVLLGFGYLVWSHAAFPWPMERRTVFGPIPAHALVGLFLGWVTTIIGSCIAISILEVIVRGLTTTSVFTMHEIVAAAGIAAGLGSITGIAVTAGFISVSLLALILAKAAHSRQRILRSAARLGWPVLQAGLAAFLVLGIAYWQFRNAAQAFGMSSGVCEMLGFVCFLLAALCRGGYTAPSSCSAGGSAPSPDGARAVVLQFWCGLILAPLLGVVRTFLPRSRASGRGIVRSQYVAVFLVLAGVFTLATYLTYWEFMDYSRALHKSTTTIMILTFAGMATILCEIADLPLGKRWGSRPARPARIVAVFTLLVLLCLVPVWGLARGIGENVRFFLMDKVELARVQLLFLQRRLPTQARSGGAVLARQPAGLDGSPALRPPEAAACPQFVASGDGAASDGQRRLGAKRLPLLLLVTVETYRADHSSLYCHTSRSFTPRIDQFGRENVVFLNSYSSSTSTRQSITSLLTGRYTSRYLLQRQPLPFLEALRAAGYEVLYTDSYYEGVIRTSLGELPSSPRIARVDGWYANEVLPAFFKELDARAAPPRGVCAILHLNGPHFPYHPTTSPPSPDPERRYEQCLEELDEAWDGFLQGLRSRGWYDDSIIVLTSDHGEEFWEHGHKYHGLYLYQETVRVPMIVKLNRPLSRRIPRTVAAIDILPSVMDFLGLPARRDLHGRSFAKALADEHAAEEAPPVFISSAIRDAYTVIVENRWKLIFSRDYGYLELYDLRSDPRETRNLADDRIDLLSDLRALLDRFLEQGRDSYATPDPFRNDATQARESR
jgi:hypothetical protein